MTTANLRDALLAEGPATEHAAALDLYGRFIGNWCFDATVHTADGGTHRGEGRIHFGWVLEGNAIQDVWVLPGFFAGTTLRVYDPGLDAWHVLWSDPLRQYYSRQLGRDEDGDIVQLGRDDSGDEVRWRFTGIGTDRFRWLGERRAAGAPGWRLEADFRAHRVSRDTEGRP